MQEIHQHGFQSASLNRILEKTALTKGALYHHFPTKQALGYAVVEELLSAYLDTTWLQPLADIDDPIDAIEYAMQHSYDMHGPEILRYGCPLSNLSQEMSGIDEGFRERINKLHASWQAAITQALQRGQKSAVLKDDLDINSVALFIMASIEGCIGIAKNRQCSSTLQSCCQGLSNYLNSLRP